MRVGNLDARRDITDVRDVGRAPTAADGTRQARPPVQHLSGPRLPDRRSARRDCCASRGRRSQSRVDPARLRPNDSPVFSAIASRIATEVGWAPRDSDRADTLHDMLDYWRQRVAARALMAARRHDEARRKIVHIAMGGFALLLRYLKWWQAALLALSRRSLQPLRPAAGRRHRLYRHGERRGSCRSGIVLYPTRRAAARPVLPARLDIVAAAWAILAAGDGMATLVGRALGGGAVPWNRGEVDRPARRVHRLRRRRGRARWPGGAGRRRPGARRVVLVARADSRPRRGRVRRDGAGQAGRQHHRAGMRPRRCSGRSSLVRAGSRRARDQSLAVTRSSVAHGVNLVVASWAIARGP